MHIETKLTLIGAGSVLLLDTIASLLSVHFHFSYALFFPASLAVYFGVTYWAAGHMRFKSALVYGAFIGLVDATLGWKLSDLLGADTQNHLQKITFSRWCGTVVFVMILGAVVALVAFLFATRRNRRQGR